MAETFDPSNPFPTQTGSLSATSDDINPTLPVQEDMMAPAKLLAIFERCKKEAFASRWVWEREWLRDVFYITNRHWIYWHPSRREWVDKRLQKNVPRPVTNKMAEVVQALRATFGSISLGILSQPIGHNTESVATADVVDKLAPLIHEEHRMTQVMREGDFWLLGTGSVCLQTSWDNDIRFNRIFIPYEQCMQCGTTSPPAAIVENMNMCPACGGTAFKKAINPDGTPLGEWSGYGRGKTVALSPFEYALPPNTTRFDETPYIIRMRWRDKYYFEANHPDILHKIAWEKTPTDRSLQIYKSLAFINDLGAGSSWASSVGGHGDEAEGVTEYELWMRPTPKYPEGLVMRVIGDKSPMLIEKKDESIPGPLPYKDRDGAPLFPFAFAIFEHIGGRLYGRSVLAPLIQKQDQLNQLDSLIQMIIQRTANPVWIVPEGSGIDQFTGDPGLVLKYNPLAAGGAGKPERIGGENVQPALFRLREQYLKDIEELAGTYDIIKGTKPAGVEAFSALQLLVERSQARFTSAFASRGEMYRSWFTTALELERAYGPQERILTVVTPNKGYTFKAFQKAQLQGNVSIKVEDGTDTPKTSLGKRAAIEHANQLQLLQPQDPEQRYTLLAALGLGYLAPSLDVHIQTALQLQDSFERWVQDPQGPMPLVMKPWYDPGIHYGERVKWLNSDHMRELIERIPQLEQVITLHLQEINMMMAPPPMVGPDGKPLPPEGVGGGRAMQNSNANSGGPAGNPATNPSPQPRSF